MSVEPEKNSREYSGLEIAELIQDSKKQLDKFDTEEAFDYALFAKNVLKNLKFEKGLKPFQKTEILLYYSLQVADAFLNIARYFNSLIHEKRISKIEEIKKGEEALAEIKTIIDNIRDQVAVPTINTSIRKNFDLLMSRYEHILTSFTKFKLSQIKELEKKLDALNRVTSQNPNELSDILTKEINEIISQLDFARGQVITRYEKKLKLSKINKEKEPIVYQLVEYLKKLDAFTNNDIRILNNLHQQGQLDLKEFTKWLAAKIESEEKTEVNWFNIISRLNLEETLTILNIAIDNNFIDQQVLKNILDTLISPKLKKEYEEGNFKDEIFKKLLNLYLKAGYTKEDLLIFFASDKKYLNQITSEEKKDLEKKIEERRLTNGLNATEKYKPNIEKNEAIDFFISAFTFKLNGEKYNGQFGDIYFKSRTFNQFNGVYWINQQQPPDDPTKNNLEKNFSAHDVDIEMQITNEANIFVPKPGKLIEDSIILEPQAKYELRKDNNGDFSIKIEEPARIFNIKYKCNFFDIPFRQLENNDFTPENDQFTEFYTKHNDINLSSDAQTLLSNNSVLNDFNKIQSTLTWVGNNIKWADSSNLVAKQTQENFDRLNGSQHYAEYILNLPAEERLADCDMRTIVALTLLRIQDIPCRAATGHISDQSNVFNPHGWLEIYLVGYGWYQIDIMGDNPVTTDNKIESEDEENFQNENTVNKTQKQFIFQAENSEIDAVADADADAEKEKREESEKRKNYYKQFLEIITNPPEGIIIINSDLENYEGKFIYTKEAIQQKYEEMKAELLDFIINDIDVGDQDLFIQNLCTELRFFDSTSYSGKNYGYLSIKRRRDLYSTLKNLLNKKDLSIEKKGFLRQCIFAITTITYANGFTEKNKLIKKASYKFIQKRSELDFLQQLLKEECQDKDSLLLHMQDILALLEILPPKEAQDLTLYFSKKIIGLIPDNLANYFFYGIEELFEIILKSKNQDYINILTNFYFDKFKNDILSETYLSSSQTLFCELLIKSDNDNLKEIFELLLEKSFLDEGLLIKIFVELLNRKKIENIEEILTKIIENRMIFSETSQLRSAISLLKNDTDYLINIKNRQIRERIFQYFANIITPEKVKEEFDNETDYIFLYYFLLRNILPEELSISNPHVQNFLNNSDTSNIFYLFPNSTTSGETIDLIIISRSISDPKERIEENLCDILNFTLDDFRKALILSSDPKNLKSLRIVFEERLRNFLLFYKDKNKFSAYITDKAAFTKIDLYDVLEDNDYLEDSDIYNQLDKFNPNYELGNGIVLLSDMLLQEKGIKGWIQELPGLFAYIKEAIALNLISFNSLFDITKAISFTFIKNLPPESVKAFVNVLIMQLIGRKLSKTEQTFYLMLIHNLTIKFSYDEKQIIQENLLKANYSPISEGKLNAIYENLSDANKLILLIDLLGQGINTVDLKNPTNTEDQTAIKIFSLLEKLKIEKIKLTENEKERVKYQILEFISLKQTERAKIAYSYILAEKNGLRPENDLIYEEFKNETYQKFLNPPEIAKILEIAKQIDLKIQEAEF